jgi:PAS domain S-box-containing protein
VTLDVTERRAMQEKIQQWNAELERTVAVRTAELTTEQARATRALERVAASESRFRTMFEQAPLGVALIESLNGRICEVNSRFAEIVGRTREELVTSFWMSQLHPDDAQADLDNVAKLNSGGIPCVRFDNRCIRPDGSLVWVRMTHAPLKLDAGEMPRHLCMIEDVTERRAADEALRASEEKFRSLVENISECIWELDAQGRFTYISPTFRELTGYSPDEYLGKTPASLISADGDRIFRELAQAAKEDQHRIPPVEFRGRRKDGQCYDVEVKGMIRCSNAGQFLGMRGIVRDITDRKRAEESLKRFNEDLERQVQQRTAAIHMLRDVAVMANETHDPLLAAEYCLKQIATQHGWLCGHVWWMDGEDEKFLLPRCVWYPADTCRWDEFRTVTLQTRLRRNTELPGRAIAGGRPHWTTQLQRALIAPRAAVARKLGLATAVAAPVFARGRPVAVLEFFSECQLPRDPGIVDVLTGVTLQLGRVFERREFEEHLLASTEDVRRGIAQDLHDDVGQELTGVSLLAAALAKSNPPATPSAEKISSEISSSLSRTHEKLRSLCHSAMPRELQEGNLVIAIKQLAVFTRDNSRIECDFAYELPEEAFDSRSSTQLYRIVQEAISNAIRHARARSIRIAMRQERGDLLLTIEDDGKGLPDGLPMSHGMGLQTMRYRAGMLGGTLEVGPAQGRGMRVVCRVPAAIQSSPTPTAAKRDSRCRRKS